MVRARALWLPALLLAVTFLACGERETTIDPGSPGDAAEGEAEGENEGEGEGEGLAEGEGEEPPVGRWYRGNLHSHTWPLSSDCRGELREHSHFEVIDWYRSQGWHFLVFTEHDAFEVRSGLSTSDFLVIDGLEMTYGEGDHYGVHVGAIGIDHMLDVPGSLDEKIDRVFEAGGIPIVNHPEWSLEITNSWNRDEGRAVEEIFRSRARHMEVWNTNVETWVVDPENDERIWDRLLSRGKRIYGVATDDSHGFQHVTGSWIEVWAPALTQEAILEGIDRGRFYASNGVRIHRIRAANGNLEVETDGERVELLGPNEELRATVAGGSITYDMAGEPWVRVRATRGTDTAWSQAIYPEDELDLGAAWEPVQPDPRGPSIVLVEDLTPGDLSGSPFAGADINEIVAELTDGSLLRPVEVVPSMTCVLDPSGRSAFPDPQQVLDDGLSCESPGWAGFVCLGGLGAKVAVRFGMRLPPGTRVRVQEVDQGVCPTASATPEPWQASACWAEQEDACTLLGRCMRGGACTYTIGEEHLEPAD